MVDTRNRATAPGIQALLQEALEQRQKQQRACPALCKRDPVLSSHHRPLHPGPGSRVREPLTHLVGLQRESADRKKERSQNTRTAAWGLLLPGLVTLKAQVDPESGFARPAPVLSPSSSPASLLGRSRGFRF